MSIPARELPNVAWKRVLREIRSRTARRRPRGLKIGSTSATIAAQFRERTTPRFFGFFPEQAALIAQFYPEQAWQTLSEADRICAHQLEMLGSGLTHLGDVIDWQQDFKSGHRWPLIHHTRLTLSSPSGGFDVKVPWELSRFHHGLRLGQAYLYTLDEKYAAELIAQISHWITTNPYEFGVNWAGPMDVAIRAVNWIWSVYMIVNSDLLTDKFLALWLASLQQHGTYIASHLEDGWPRTNHYIANLTGLAYLGILFPEFKDAKKWREIGIQGLWNELEYQLTPDGMSYEASIPYHRLVTEMTLSVAALCTVNNIPIPQMPQARIRAMLDILMTYTQPDGLSPQIGDADDGRLLPLSLHSDPVRAVQDHRHLLALGSLILERELPDWAGFIDPTARGWAIAAGDEWQDAFWYFASDTAARLTDVISLTTPRPDGISSDDWVDVRPGVRLRARALSRRPLRVDEFKLSRGFEASGFYILRNKDYYLSLNAGDVGSGGAGGHAHNDTLSLTLYALGRQFLVDPGSYLYTSNPTARNHFRSTAFHNTLQVNNEEINPLPANLFRLPGKANITIHHWISKDAYDMFDASHSGYTRLTPPLIHRRQVWFDKQASLWVIHDALRLVESPDEETNAENEKMPYTVSLTFHFAPMPLHIDKTNHTFRTENEEGANLAILPLGDFPLEGQLKRGHIAPSYGLRKEAPIAAFSGQVRGNTDIVLLLYPHQNQMDSDAVRSVGREALLTMRDILRPVRKKQTGRLRASRLDRIPKD